MKWRLKIFCKILLSKFPFHYSIWKSFGLFKHGKMDSLEYPIKIFNLHIKKAYPEIIPRNLTTLELGPGDSIASAIIGYAYGVSKTYLIDVGDYATKDISFYKELANKLKFKGLRVPDLSEVSSFEEILKLSNAMYLKDGLDSLKDLKSNSIDYIWSHSVLEHIRKKTFLKVQKELIRILKPSGIISHNIDFQDHLDHSLNSLRFSEKLWESDLFANAGFYTNRIPAKRMHTIFKEVGFIVKKESFGKWPLLPTRRKDMDKEFDIYSDSELINRTSYVLLSK